MRHLVLVTTALIAVLTIAAPASAHHPRRDADGARDHQQEGNGFHRYYSSGYDTTDGHLTDDRRDDREWRGTRYRHDHRSDGVRASVPPV